MRKTQFKMWQNSKTQNLTTQYDKIQILQICQNSKTQNMTIFKNKKIWQNSKLKIWLNLKTQNLTKHKKSKCDKI